MPSRTIIISGARGGQGASTVAAALALFAAGQHRTVLSSADERSMAALLGVPAASAGPGRTVEITPTLHLARRAGPDTEVLVIDAASPGDGDDPEAPAERYTVLRGPCYLALASLVRSTSPAPDGVILVAEPGRSLTATDVAEVLGIPVVASVQADPAVARTIDAGLLPARLSRLRPLAALRPLAQALAVTAPVP